MTRAQHELVDRTWRALLLGLMTLFVVNIGLMIAAVATSSFARRWLGTWLPEGWTIGWYTAAWKEFQLDAVLWVQANLASDLAVRWNCKAAKCGSCSAEIEGFPRLMCKTAIAEYGGSISVRPMKAFPVIKDLVTDVSWNYEVAKKIPPLKPKTPEADGTWRMQQMDIERIQEF